VNSGRLRHRVAIESRADGLDALGQPLDTWESVATLWADIRDSRGREFTESQQAQINETTVNIRLRYRADLLPEMRVRELCHAARIFNVTSVRYTSPPRPEVMLECEELRVAAGALS
jgi:SPP1 family predicted phage head-tail adaptor